MSEFSLTSNDNIPLRLRLVSMLLKSTALHESLPEVRLRALIETASAQESDEGVVAFAVEALTDSPYLPPELKMAIADMCFNEDWEGLAYALGCQADNILLYDNIVDPSFARFRTMVTTIFTRSKKVQTLPPQRIRELGAQIHMARSVDQLMEITVRSLEQSVLFGEDDKQRIMNDILDKRYDRLLLPDRFDCHERREAGAEINEQERQRVAQNVELENECPVCLGNDVVDMRLPCGHELCESCIQDWIRANGTPCLCPLCRAEFTFADCTNIN